MIHKIFISCFFVLCSSMLMMGSNTHHIASPDGHIIVTFEVSKKGEIFLSDCSWRRSSVVAIEIGLEAKRRS